MGNSNGRIAHFCAGSLGACGGFHASLTYLQRTEWPSCMMSGGLVFSKVVGQLLLPPADLVLIGVTGLLAWRHRWGKLLVVLSFSLLWLLSISPVRDGLISPLEHRYPPLALNAKLGSPSDTAIVVFGGSTYARAPEYGGVSALHQSALSRTLYAADLARRSGLDVFPSGGKAMATLEPDAETMRRGLIRFGVPASHIFVENKANTTWQNARRLKQMLVKRDINRVVLVTSAWHMPRAVWSMKAQGGITVIPAPCDYLEGMIPNNILDYLPKGSTLRISCLALHEYLGLLWYHIRYGALDV